jgi:tetratricopeptide (TPR) repeat protein
MTNSENLQEWFKNTFRKQFEDIKDVQDWKVLKDAAIYRKHTGDLDGAIDAMEQAVRLMRTIPHLAEETALNLNYLAAELYLPRNAIHEAEQAIRESMELSRLQYAGLLAANFWILAGILNRKGEYREALASAEESLRLSQQQEHPYGVAQAEELIAQIKTNLQ